MLYSQVAYSDRGKSILPDWTGLLLLFIDRLTQVSGKQRGRERALRQIPSRTVVFAFSGG